MASQVEPKGLSAGRLAAAMAVALALGGGGAYWWHGRTAPGSALPAAPDLTGRPAELSRMLRDAQARVAKEGASAASLATLGRIYHANGFVREAEACWQRLRALQPAEARWTYYLSDLSRLSANEQTLRSWLEETVKLAPRYSPAWLELAELEFKTGRLARAEQAYRERLRLTPGDPYASLGLARLALQQDRRAEGRRLIEDLVKRVPDFPSSHNVYAEILAQEGDQAAAANQRWLGTVAGRFRVAADPWKEDLRSYCCDVDQLVVWGAIDLQTKFGDRGRAYFERAIQVDSRNPEGFENLGLYHLETGDPAKAVEVLERGAQLPTASELLYSYLGDAYLQLRQPDQALAVAERGAKLMPSSARFQNLRGLALAAAGRPDEAMAAYRAAMALSPGLVDPVANLGLALLRQGRREEATAMLKQALVLQPGYAKAVTTLGHLALDAGDLPLAATYVFPYFQQFPGLANARVLMARYYLTMALGAAQRGDPAAVEQACRQGLAIVPDSPELNGFLGINLAQAGRVEEGLAALETSYRLQPADPRVALALGELYIRSGRGAEARRVLEATAQEAARRNDAAIGAQVAAMLQRIP